MTRVLLHAPSTKTCSKRFVCVVAQAFGRAKTQLELKQVRACGSCLLASLKAGAVHVATYCFGAGGGCAELCRRRQARARRGAPLAPPLPVQPRPAAVQPR